MMKSIFILLFYYALAIQVQAQTYRAKNVKRTYEVTVPAKVVRNFERTYPDVQVDSCYVEGDDAEPEGWFVFYGTQQSRAVSTTFDKEGRQTESTAEITIQELPQQLQKVIAYEKQKGNDVGRVVKKVVSLQRGQKVYYMKRVAYMIEQYVDYQGKRLKVPMHYNEDGYPTSGFW